MSVEYNMLPKAVWSPTSKTPSEDTIVHALSIHPSLDYSWDQGLVCSEEELGAISGEAIKADIHVHRPEQATRSKQRKDLNSRQEQM